MSENKEYLKLLKDNDAFNKRREVGTPAHRELQRKLLDIELKMSSKEIIRHTEIAFPNVQE